MDWVFSADPGFLPPTLFFSPADPGGQVFFRRPVLFSADLGEEFTIAKIVIVNTNTSITAQPNMTTISFWLPLIRILLGSGIFHEDYGTLGSSTLGN